MKEERINVNFETDVFKARRIGKEMAHSLGFDEIGVGEIETAISELATNLIKHGAKNGKIILKKLGPSLKLAMVFVKFMALPIPY